ncbi:MAG: type II toxin-antitoxin system VapC family toxin [Methylococcales bacterium]
MRFLLDTNAILYFLQDRLEQPLPRGNYFFSIITEIELFSYPQITLAEEGSIRRLLASMTRVALNFPVRDKTITIRRANRLKLPDAIIAASALLHDAVLLSNDNGFETVVDLQRQALKIKSSK